MNEKKIIIATIVGTFVILVGAYFLISAVGNNKPKALVASYSSTDKKKPQVELKTTLANLGTIKVSDEKSQDFTLKNVGSKPLELSNIVSSCMCTVGQVFYQGKKSEEFGMHSQSDYLASIAPGQQATLRVTYRPSVMPVSGAVEREVYVNTNDPANQKLVFKVTANVQ